MDYAKLTTLCFIMTVLPAMAAGAQNDEEISNKYTAVPSGSGPGIWIIDVETGKPVLCFPDGKRPRYKIICVDQDN